MLAESEDSDLTPTSPCNTQTDRRVGNPDYRYDYFSSQTVSFILVCCVLVASTIAEPPVDNRYLPPQSFSSSPSQAYGAPAFGQRQTGAGFRTRPSSTYGTPSRSQSLSNQYIPPRSSPTSQYQAPSSQYQAPSSKYQSPSSLYQAPSSQYQARSSFNQASSSLYQAPANQYQSPSSQYGLPSQAQRSASGSYTAPSQEYGLPGLGRGGNQAVFGGNDLSQSRQYLPPGRGYDDGSNGEPANYSFEYMVQDDYSGNDFGHRESRQGDRAEGVYYVLLPDGRKQTVQYEADEEGYKPRISYEDTGRGAGYDRNSQAYNNQYNNGPY
ncbi:pro-resilin-like [Bicyclus anynana]|uniref:Pro-resilin-like n=1 Tax=Bicyclus anynana TaxID=110368 RepID=A0ABM3LV63_BICAN|nr:pro-resilin-like [Bicyclus anynana]